MCFRCNTDPCRYLKVAVYCPRDLIKGLHKSFPTKLTSVSLSQSVNNPIKKWQKIVCTLAVASKERSAWLAKCHIPKKFPMHNKVIQQSTVVNPQMSVYANDVAVSLLECISCAPRGEWHLNSARVRETPRIGLSSNDEYSVQKLQQQQQ